MHDPRNTRARGEDDGSSKQTPSNDALQILILGEVWFLRTT